MKKIISSRISLLILVALSFSLSGCGFIKGSSNPAVDSGIKKLDKLYPEDNFIEESIEDGIESLTGIDLDFSPCSIEEK